MKMASLPAGRKFVVHILILHTEFCELLNYYNRVARSHLDDILEVCVCLMCCLFVFCICLNFSHGRIGLLCGSKLDVQLFGIGIICSVSYSPASGFSSRFCFLFSLSLSIADSKSATLSTNFDTSRFSAPCSKKLAAISASSVKIFE